MTAATVGLEVRRDERGVAEVLDRGLGRADQVDLGALPLDPVDVLGDLAGRFDPLEPDQPEELEHALGGVGVDLDRDVVEHAPQPLTSGRAEARRDRGAATAIAVDQATPAAEIRRSSP